MIVHLLAFLVLAQAGAPPTPAHYVTDTASALSAPARDSIESELRAYEKKTGNQVIVWIGQSTGDTPLEVWTGDTAQRWKIGHAHKDNGAVLFLFMRDRKIRIEVGYGLEGDLPDASAKRIIDTVIRPQMRRGNTDAAVADGVGAMLTTITPGYAVPTPAAGGGSVDASDSTPGWAVALFLLLFFGVPLGVIILIAVAVARRKKTPFGKALHDVWFWGGSGMGGFSHGGFGGGGFSGGFSAGGGGFGGGGASGGW